MSQRLEKKKFVFDMFLNIVATAIPTFALQLIILPLISRDMSDERYGLLLTILSLLNIVPATIGNALNNVRLIQGEDTDNKAGYNLLLLVLSVINFFVILVFSFIYEKGITVISLVLTIVTSLLWLVREYYIVAFRIKINYLYILISNLILVVGYVIGYLLFRFTGHWQYIYILGLLLSLLFIFAKCDLWKEPFTRGTSFKYISVQTLLLIVAGLLTRITTYADKMLIFPILGGAVVSVYYTATLFGKIVSLVITPISGVMLSYLSGMSKKNDNLFRLTFISGSIVCFFGYFICVAISRPVLGILYPQFVDQAMDYIWITTGTTVLIALTSIINPFVLRFFDMKWQIAINAVYVVIYVFVSLLLLSVYGLYGFCFGALAATLLKLVCLVLIYSRCKEKA